MDFVEILSSAGIDLAVFALALHQKNAFMIGPNGGVVGFKVRLDNQLVWASGFHRREIVFEQMFLNGCVPKHIPYVVLVQNADNPLELGGTVVVVSQAAVACRICGCG